MGKFLKLYAMAFHTLTLFHAGPFQETHAKDLASSLSFFPLVGLFLGVILNTFYELFQFVFPEEIMDFLVVMGLVALSGACHVTRFAALVEGTEWKNITSGSSSVTTPRLGLFAAILLIFLQWSKFDALTLLQPSVKIQAIILFPMMGHWAMVLGCGLANLWKRGREPEGFIRLSGTKEQILAAGFTLGISALFLKLNAIPAIFIMGVTLFMLTWSLRKGSTPIGEPFLGVCHELGGAVFLFGLLWTPF